MAHSFHVSTHQFHYTWSRKHEPVIRVASGGEVSFDLHDGSDNQITAEHPSLEGFDVSRIDPCSGPVFVEGAEPGDTLRVDILDLEPSKFAWTVHVPGIGLLRDDPEFRDVPGMQTWDLSESALVQADIGKNKSGYRLWRAQMKPGISVPLDPFVGIMGVAPAPGTKPAGPALENEGDAPDHLSTVPAYHESGGNIDCRSFREGAAIYFPVHVPGALFSAGDGHGTQGDGEVCGTAMETQMKARFRFTVLKKSSGSNTAERDSYIGTWRPKSIYCMAPPRDRERALTEVDEDCGEYTAVASHHDPLEASKLALRGLLEWLCTVKGLSPSEAYILASVAAHLRMAAVVNTPNYTISCSLPMTVFAKTS